MNMINPKVIDRFLDRAKNWKEEMKLLRKICLDCGLDEDFKWMHPCYTFEGKNIVLIHGFKEYCALLFHKGALLRDMENILVQQTENVQAARQIRFANIQEIVDSEPTIKAYIFEAIEVEKAGLEVKMKKTKEFNVPEELQKNFNENAESSSSNSISQSGNAFCNSSKMKSASFSVRIFVRNTSTIVFKNYFA